MKIIFLRTLLLLCTIFAVIIFQPQQAKAELFSQEEKSSKKLHQLNILEIDSLITDISRTHSTTKGKIAVYSRLALGTPYVHDCLGEGLKGKYDKDSLIDLAE